MKPKVFVGCSVKALEIAEHVQRELRYISEPELWTTKFRQHDTPIESLFKCLNDFDFALFITFAEDQYEKNGQRTWSMRDNVLFEIGLFLGRLGRDRVFMISPSNKSAILNLPSDLTGIEPVYYDSLAENTAAAVGGSLAELKDALRKFRDPGLQKIFDSSIGLQPYQLVFKGGRLFNELGEPISEEATGNVNITDEAIEFTRTNALGNYEIEIRPKGRGEPSIPRLSNSYRIFEVRFEAKTEMTPHDLRVVLMEDKIHRWIANHTFEVVGQEWKVYSTPLQAPPHIDILIRIDDYTHQATTGKLCLRNISIKQFRV